MTRSPTSCRTAAALALIVGLLLAGCAAGGPSPSATGSGSAAASASEPTESLPPFACAPTITIPATADRAQITDVRVSTHQAYDRVVFEFAGGIPQTVIAGVLPPFFRDPSGLPVDVAGATFLNVTMHGGTKLRPEGGVTYAGSTNFEPAFAQLVQLIEGGDFEAISTWYLGLDPGGCIRVLTLAGPSRLVIDIEH